MGPKGKWKIAIVPCPGRRAQYRFLQPTSGRSERPKGEIILGRSKTGSDPDTGKPVFEDQPLDLALALYRGGGRWEPTDPCHVGSRQDIEAAVQRLAQMARAAGIHLIMATQRPSADVITGTIATSRPASVFRSPPRSTAVQSLVSKAPKQLLGQGDMLYMSGGGRIARVHGPFVRDEDDDRSR